MSKNIIVSHWTFQTSLQPQTASSLYFIWDDSKIAHPVYIPKFPAWASIEQGRHLMRSQTQKSTPRLFCTWNCLKLRLTHSGTPAQVTILLLFDLCHCKREIVFIHLFIHLFNRSFIYQVLIRRSQSPLLPYETHSAGSGRQ